MKINMKIAAVFLAIALVLIEGYLIVSSIIDTTAKNNQIQSYCGIHCEYNPASFLWEFAGETYTKGFTTRDECFSYCSKVKQGFVYNFLSKVNTASLFDAFNKVIGK